MSDSPDRSDPPALDRGVTGVLYRWLFTAAGGTVIQYESTGAEDLLELTADELAERLSTRSLPLYGVDADDFYDTAARSALAHVACRYDIGFVGPRTGRRRWLHVAKFPSTTRDGRKFFNGVIVDITPIKLAEEQMRRAHRTLSGHMENTPLAVIEWDAAVRVVRWSGQAERMFGWTAAEVLGKQLEELKFVYEADAEAVRAVSENLTTRAEPRNVSLNRNYHKDGRVLMCEWHNSCVLDEDGKLLSILSLVQDLTASRAVQSELELAQRRLRTVLSHARLLVWDQEIQSGEFYFSQSVGEFFDMPELKERPEGSAAYLVVHPDDREATVRVVEEWRRTGGEVRFEFRGTKPAADGGPRWFEAIARFVQESNAPARAFGVTMDITARKRVEAERLELDRELDAARRFESLGVLAGGLAHDFNNLLTVILGNASVARMQLPPTSPVARALTEIEAASQRAAHLCSQMTAYTGVGRLAVSSVDFVPLVKQADAAFRRAVGERNSLAVLLPPAVPPVTGESHQLRQAVLNVLTNAGEAIEPGGTVTLSVAAYDWPSDAGAEGFAPTPMPGRYVRVTVTDGGKGMTADELSKAFDPFFSTKFAGRGLGLSAVQGIVRGHRGAVRILSQPGVGTTVDLLFPVSGSGSRAMSVMSTERAMSPEAERTPRGRVLVVDDEMNIRELIASLLEDDGFTVSTHANGPHALAGLSEDAGECVLAVVDLMMPGMDGFEVVRRLRAVRSNLPVVLVSGYADRSIPSELKAGGPIVILAKPFRIEELMATVRRLLA